MNVKTWAIPLLFFYLMFQIFENQAQKINEYVSFKWEKTYFRLPSEEKKQEFLYFKGAVSDKHFESLPLFTKRYIVDNFYENYEYAVENVVFEEMSSDEAQLIPEDFNNTSIEVTVKTMVESHRNYAVISFIPIIKNGNGRFSKVISCDIILRGISLREQKRDKRSYVSNSVLQFGNWYKIAVAESGLYKVTYSDMANLGIPVSGLSSNRISLFGNGGGMLSEANSVNRVDDLIENPIRIFDGGDGVFNQGDYFIFYAEGPHRWDYVNGYFTHTYNIYSDEAYYFINVDEGIGTTKRVNIVDNTGLLSNNSTETYTYYDFIESDVKNFGETGQQWYGDAFDVQTSRDYSFSLPGGASSSVQIKVSAVGVATQSSSLSVLSGSFSLGVLNFSSVGDSYASHSAQRFSYVPSSGQTSLPLTLTYSKPSVSSAAYLDYIEIEAKCQLQMTSSEFLFSSPEAVGIGKVTEFSISNANNQVHVWDVTDLSQVHEIQGQLTGGVLKIKSETEQLRKFIAYNGTSFKSVRTVEKIANQNLHGTSDVNMIIVTHPGFQSQAERLAQYRREQDGLTVKVVTPQQIYNEFSSGAQDATAIRDYMRMIYKTSSSGNPKYLLLFGKPSYDYRGRIDGNVLFVPNYQSSASLNKNSFRANDDYFGLLDDTEGEDCQGYVDVAIGRFPVTNTTQAKIAVDKTILYSTRENLVPANSTVVSNFADWRNLMAFVADDEDSYHILTTESGANFVEEETALINFDKIYLDSYQQVSSAGEQRYPEVNQAIEHRIKKGSLVFTYVGHSGVKGWAHERILDLQTINNWDNQYNQPILITMGCEFGWYDRSVVSPSELAFLNPIGGATGLITTSRVAFSLSNKTYSDYLFKNIMKKFDNRYQTLGELNKTAKNGAGGASNTLNMIYTIGDPSMKLAIPTFSVVTDSINGNAASGNNDTLKALSKVTIKGRLVDDAGIILSGFNGNLYPSVFDKKVKVATLQNDPQSLYYEYYVQKNVLFRGNVTVKNGMFEFSFIVPQDINFEYGKGKISYYASSSNSDAGGSFENFLVGGRSGEVITDVTGPEIDVYMNDENFVNGGITNQNPTLIVKLQDQYGINTTGNGIGHDLVAILDGKTEEQVVLNDYYMAVQDSFNCGTVRYPYKNLSPGKHTLKLRAWDILNNVSEKSIDFVVASDEELTLEHVLNYPNPFTTRTAFYFEHNIPAIPMDVMIQIFTVSGKIVKTLESSQITTGNRSEPIYWDGRDDYGDVIGKGTYIYRLKVRTSDGKSAEKIEKLVIL